MKNFDDVFTHLIEIEGGYVNNPKDKGGETKYGITVSVARQYGYTGKMKDLTIKKAKEIYKTEYWDKLKPENLPHFNIKFLLFDFAVNSGVKQAIKHLQASLNILLKNTINYTQLIVDGILGQKTKSALDLIENNDYFIMQLQQILINERLRFYTSLSKTQFNTFGKGWINRIIKNNDFLNKNLD